MESSLTRKLQRKLEKVQSKRRLLQLLGAIQASVCAPFVAYLLWPHARRSPSLLASWFAALSAFCSGAGLLGLLAATARRVQMLAVFCAFEIFAVLLIACANSAMLLLYQLQCASDEAFRDLSGWGCNDILITAICSGFMLLLVTITAAAALALRFRIQKTGKRNLDWNTRPQRWKERNLRRGASAALRALWGSKDGVYDEECFVKYLVARDRKYVDRSLTLRFATIDSTSERAEERVVILNLRKGYFKLGSFFKSKVYLSQVQRLVLCNYESGERPDVLMGSGRLPLRHTRRGPASRVSLPPRWLSRLAGRLCGRRFSIARAVDEEAGGRVFGLHVDGQQHFGVKSLFGLSTRYFSCDLEFARVEERDRFVGFLRALLPAGIPIDTKIVHTSVLGDSINSLLNESLKAAASNASLKSCRHAERANASAFGVSHSDSLESAHDLSGNPALNLAAALGASTTVAASVGGARNVATETVSVLTATWNMGDSSTPHALHSWLPVDAYDLYAVATQECNDEHWVLAVEAHLGSNYVRIGDRRMGHVVLALFCHRRHAAKISSVESSYTPTGVLGVGTNKGAVAISLSFRGARLCFVNAHLAAHQEKILQRNLHLQGISKHLRLGHTALEIPMQFNTIWCGDLNYRIEETRDTVLRLIESRSWRELYERDQLQQEMSQNKVLFGFEEAELGFPPSYKYVRGPGPNASARRLGKSVSKQNMLQTRKKRGGAEDGRKSAALASVQLQERLERGGERNSRAPCPPTAEGSSGISFANPSIFHSPRGRASNLEDDSAMLDQPLAETGGRRRYDEEKARVPSWCDRVLWRGLPGSLQLRGGQAVDCEDITSSDHAPVSTLIELEVPIIPHPPELFHCTLYISKLQLIRELPPIRKGASQAASAELGPYTSNRDAHGKGVPLPVAGAKLQNLPPALTVHCYFLVLQRLMAEPPQFFAPLSASGGALTNVVIGPMLAQPAFLQTQHVHFRITSHAGSKNSQVGQACISLAEAAGSSHATFDVMVEHNGVPAGFNLRGEVLVAYTKYLSSESARHSDLLRNSLPLVRSKLTSGSYSSRATSLRTLRSPPASALRLPLHARCRRLRAQSGSEQRPTKGENSDRIGEP